jgi:hypothetical protein
MSDDLYEAIEETVRTFFYPFFWTHLFLLPKRRSVCNTVLQPLEMRYCRPCSMWGGKGDSLLICIR